MKVTKILGLAALPVVALSVASCRNNDPVAIQHNTTITDAVINVLNYGFSETQNTVALQRPVVIAAIDEAVTEVANGDVNFHAEAATDGATAEQITAQNNAILAAVVETLNDFLQPAVPAEGDTPAVEATPVFTLPQLAGTTVAVVDPTGDNASDFDFRVNLSVDFATTTADVVAANFNLTDANFTFAPEMTEATLTAALIEAVNGLAADANTDDIEAAIVTVLVAQTTAADTATVNELFNINVVITTVSADRNHVRTLAITITDVTPAAE